jgi:hypothetical protein
MTWVEIGVLALIADRAVRAAWGFYRGARAVYRAVDEVSSLPPPREPLWPRTTTTQRVRTSVEIASDDAVSLDYSSGSKRH